MSSPENPRGLKARGSLRDFEKCSKYEITLEVDRDELADDMTGQIMLRVKQLAQRAAEHKDSLLATLLANGDQAGYVAYDGKVFFAADHESGDSGAQSNILTPAATDADAPTVAEFKTAMASGIQALLELVDDKGEPMNNSASGLVAVVPPSMYVTALEALSATVLSSTTNVLAGAASVVAFPRLIDASKWFLLKTDVQVRPFIFQDREPIEFTSLEQNSETGFLREPGNKCVKGPDGGWNRTAKRASSGKCSCTVSGLATELHTARGNMRFSWTLPASRLAFSSMSVRTLVGFRPNAVRGA